ncbi:DUF3592 domain-containing protein [Streptomyces sp. NBC_00078]|uniref:DUF3592 domain-containing protein n=1 Tax=unclassified Streptomyces TaxID=2593676 RepID=UPI00224D9FB9|nr:DUF3592 domain-containing protein [Streptomyces sp. NBC_00078]MCX5420893.1 DUF3592 domain-containing protein [Streptomyces sp. NBC_00078]
MVKKKRTKRAPGDWALPPKADEQKARLDESRRKIARVRQPVPQRRLILTLFALFLVAFGISLVFFVPSHSLVSDLRSRGVATWAQVTSSPRDHFGSPGNIKIQFKGPKGEVDTTLSDWGGRRPDGLVTGQLVSVTYDPHDPTRVLTTAWVKNPPIVTLPMLVSLVVSLFFLAGAVFLTLRRRRLLSERKQAETTEEPENVREQL